MKILQLIYESFGSPFGFGGAGVRAYELYERLARKHEITLLCMKYPGARDGIIKGLQHRFVGIEHPGIIKSVAAYTFRAARYLSSEAHRYNIIVENFLPTTPFFSMLFTNRPVVLQMQGLMGVHAHQKFPAYLSLPMHLVENLYPRLFSNFIFVTRLHRLKGPFNSCRHAVIPNGIDSRLLDVAVREDDYILFFSRIDSYTKGLDLLLRAFASVADRFPRTRLVLAGHEATRVDDLLALIPCRLRERVHYAGFVTGRQRTRLLADAKLFVLPSRHEAQPVSLMEAHACCKPVIVSDIPELRYVTRERLGLAFASGSADDLARKITSAMEDPGLRKVFGERGRKYASNFTWDDLARQFDSFLSSIVRGTEAGYDCLGF